MKISVINSWSQLRGHKKRVVAWFFYHFFMVILCVINIVFFAYNFFDLECNISTENIILTVVGFFFAFAGINIYSIFNTNIEIEKEQIRMQIEKYSDQLDLDVQQSHITRAMFRFIVYGQMISTTPKFNSQFLEWIAGAKDEIKYFKNFLSKLIRSGYNKNFDDLYADILFLLREEELMLDIFKNKLGSNGQSFFEDDYLPSVRSSLDDGINSLLDEIHGLESMDREDFFTSTESNIQNLSSVEQTKTLKKRFCDWILATGALLFPKMFKINVS